VHALRRLWFALLLTPALAACGGGGGTKFVSIDQNNAEDVASSAIGAAQFVADLADLVDGFVDVIEAGSGSLPCPGGGTATVTVNDLPPLGEISPGDTASLRFVACTVEFEGEQFTINGELEIRITNATFPGVDAYDILLTATFKNLLLGGLGVTFTVNGAVNLHLETPDGVVFTTTASGSQIKASIQVGAIVANNYVSNFNYEQMYDDATGDYMFTGYGRVYDSGLGGWFDSEVQVPLEGTDPDDPDTGEYDNVGKSNSSVLVVALDNVNVELRVDVDGDGVVDFTIPTTWAALFG